MKPTAAEPVSPSDLRALRARYRIPIYSLAAKVDLHSTRLGRMLNEVLPMPPEVAQKVLRAIEQFERDG